MAANPIANKIFGNGFNLIPQIGPVSLLRLFKHFGGFEPAWFAAQAEYLHAGISQKLAQIIRDKKPQINPELAFAELTRRQIEVLTIGEVGYPPLLKEVAAAPPVLYVRGNQQILTAASVAVVGTRKITSYGQQACQELITGLVQNNLSIVSGLAFGVDAQALSVCVAEGGIPVAVLASDLDNSSISPRSNFQLAQKVVERGCLVSEYPLGMVVQKQNFPIRNRIISALSLGTLVIEADMESGSLITANFALEQNREVFAVPGSIFSQSSRGTNALIKKGAKLVARVNDILEEFDITSANPAPIDLSATPQEQTVLDVLAKEPIHIDDLIKLLKLRPADLNSLLTMLEMKGRVKNLGGGKYAKVRG